MEAVAGLRLKIKVLDRKGRQRLRRAGAALFALAGLLRAGAGSRAGRIQLDDGWSLTRRADCAFCADSSRLDAHLSCAVLTGWGNPDACVSFLPPANTVQ